MTMNLSDQNIILLGIKVYFMTFNGNREKGVAVLLYLANRAKAPHG